MSQIWLGNLFHDIVAKFCKFKPGQRVDFLQKFIEYEDENHNDASKQSTIRNIMKQIIEQFEHELDHPQRQLWHHSSPRPLKQKQRNERIIRFIISLWPLANKVHFLYLIYNIQIYKIDVDKYHRPCTDQIRR